MERGFSLVRSCAPFSPCVGRRVGDEGPRAGERLLDATRLRRMYLEIGNFRLPLYRCDEEVPADGQCHLTAAAARLDQNRHRVARFLLR